MADPNEAGGDAADNRVPEDRVAAQARRHDSLEAPELEALIPFVYGELRIVARNLRRRDRLGSATWNTTAVVNEAYLKLARSDARFGNRAHFFAVAATAMRQLLIDEARRKRRSKRGDGKPPATLDERLISIDDQSEFLLLLNDALESWTRADPRLVRIVECRYFGGLTENETAEVLDISARTVRRDWIKARARLALMFGGSD